MFDRKKYKAIAKKQLKGRMTTPVLSTLVVLLLIGVLCAPAMMDSWHNAEATVSASDGVFRMGAGTVTPLSDAVSWCCPIFQRVCWRLRKGI